ncbi:MAG TPA: enoyl-CoA hydratase/isomerase family protein [Thermoanaerobaculaceae bacterium]|nr:enoyl-CoA hydratase/isomerase family protein [Thermoanaerobaculaceae bacterium]HRS15081.1 enoyl-CoA hydratase/isomerase family protein [Thermoanaerobaculaceae bacterium]
MSDLVLEQRHGKVVDLMLNRPEHHNALNLATVEALWAGLQAAVLDPQVHVIVLHGSGDGFCAGLDPALLRAMASGEDPAATLVPVVEITQRVISLLATAPKVTVGACHGFVLGIGLDLALACDLRVATAGTRFAAECVQFGLLPEGGGTWALPRLIGLGPAMAMLLSGDPVDAEGAYRLGLIHRRVALGRHLEEARRWGEELAKSSLAAQVAIKRLARVDPRLTLDAALKEEKEALRRLLLAGEPLRYLDRVTR